MDIVEIIVLIIYFFVTYFSIYLGMKFFATNYQSLWITKIWIISLLTFTPLLLSVIGIHGWLIVDIIVYVIVLTIIPEDFTTKFFILVVAWISQLILWFVLSDIVNYIDNFL